MRPWLVLALVSLLAALALASMRPPRPKPVDAPVTDFSAARARETLVRIVGDGAPHPVGTLAHDRVRELLAEELAGLGLEVARPSQLVCGRSTCANVTYLLTRMPGHVSGNAVVLTAHYDSVAAGPGASDDGMGVAIVLEVARALKASPMLRRPVWLLLTDGEELGLLGAKALARNPLLLGQMGVVVNVEARGTTGPSLMFETSERDAALVRAFAKSTAKPTASSLFPTLYSMLPNDTDLTIYKGKGIAGLNYAIIGGAARYHTPRDDLAHADLASLQHQGDNALSMVRGLADGAATTASDEDLVFFDCLSWFVVRWPARAALPLALSLVVALAISLVVAARRGLVTAADAARGLLGALAAPAAALAGGLVSAVLAVSGATPAAWVAHPLPMIVAASSLGAVAAAATVAVAARWTSPAGLLWGAAALFGLAGIALSARLVGLSFLFVAPTAGACAGSLGFTFGRDRRPEALQRWAGLMPAATVITWVPALGLVYDGLGTRFLAALAVGAGVLSWTAAPAIAALPAKARSRGLSLLGAASLGALALACVVPRFDADVPAHVSIRSYAAEGEPVRTLLFAPDGAPAALARKFPGSAAAWPWARETPAGSADAAPDAPLPAPTLEIVSTTDAPPVTRTVLRLRSSRGAAIVGLALRPGDDVRTLAIEGEKLKLPAPGHREGPWASYEDVSTPDEGVLMELTYGTGQPIEVTAFDRAPGLPPGAPRALGDARRADAVPYGAGDYSVASRRFALSPR